MNDNFAVTGKLNIIVRDTITGEIKVDTTIDNLVVTVGKNFIASRMAGTSSAVMGWMAIGTSSTSPVVGNTTLGTELARVATTVSGGTPTSNTVLYTATFPAGTGTGALQEAGIFNANSAGTMLSRTTYSVINKGALDDMTINWTITIG